MKINAKIFNNWNNRILYNNYIIYIININIIIIYLYYDKIINNWNNRMLYSLARRLSSEVRDAMAFIFARVGGTRFETCEREKKKLRKKTQ